MKRIVAITLLIGLAACSALREPIEVNLYPMDVNQFLAKPFGFNESVEAFKKNLPSKKKVQKLIKRNPKDHHSPDTIYNFIYKKSKVSVYKTRFNQEFILGGIIKNPELVLANGIRQGMDRDHFYKSFTNLEDKGSDTIVVSNSGTGRTFNFYFTKRGKLNKFTFNGAK